MRREALGWVGGAVAVVALTLAVSAASARAGSWVSVQPISASPSSRPVALFTSAGEAVVVSGAPQPSYGWGPGGPVQKDPNARVRAYVKPPGGAFGPEQTLSGGGATSYWLYANPDGSVVVRWIDSDGLEESDRPAFGKFGSPTNLIPAAELGAAGPAQPNSSVSVQVGVDRAGDMLLTWQVSMGSASGAGETDVWAQWRPAGGPFEAPVRVFAATGYATFTSALDDRGDAVIAVDGKPLTGGISDSSMFVVERSPDGQFSAPQEVSDPSEYVASYLYPTWLGLDGFAVDKRGDVALAWEAPPDGTPGAFLMFSNAPLRIRIAIQQNGMWEPAQTLWQSPPDHLDPFHGPSPAVNAGWGPAGQLGVTWGDLTGNVDFGYRPPNGSFGPTEAIPAKVAGRATNIAFDSLGNAVALATGETAIDAAVQPVGGTFGPPEPLGTSVSGLSTISFDALGDGIASWTDRINGASTIVAAYYDASPPKVTQLSLSTAAATADTAPRAPSGIRLRVSKPGLARVSLLRTTCSRIERRRHGRTVRVLRCRNRTVTGFASRVRAGTTTLPVTPPLAAALRRHRPYLLRVQATDAPGRRSAPRTLAIGPRAKHSKNS